MNYLPIALCGLSLAAANADADTPLKPEAPAVNLLTDKTWQGAEAKEDGWEKADFDAKKWPAATPIDGPITAGAHFSVENMLGFPSKARWIWGGDKEEC